MTVAALGAERDDVGEEAAVKLLAADEGCKAARSELLGYDAGAATYDPGQRARRAHDLLGSSSLASTSGSIDLLS